MHLQCSPRFFFSNGDNHAIKLWLQNDLATKPCVRVSKLCMCLVLQNLHLLFCSWRQLVQPFRSNADLVKKGVPSCVRSSATFEQYPSKANLQLWRPCYTKNHFQADHNNGHYEVQNTACQEACNVIVMRISTPTSHSPQQALMSSKRWRSGSNNPLSTRVLKSVWPVSPLIGCRRPSSSIAVISNMRSETLAEPCLLLVLLWTAMEDA